MQDTTEAPAGSSTGDTQVDAVLSALDRLADLPVTGHAEVYLDVLERLDGELNPEGRLRRTGAHGSP
ncbi:hypothetical protein V6S67_06285 [Arthrobacter sp. Soc17.1.1.1]|uniref:hypothetical protein n=1 Tax=Arthrobacter sp. Soc17.1.1.1 TaxID=3121277 RepID=UPI002FE4DDFF